MLNGSKPEDYIDLEDYCSNRNISGLVREIIGRLYGQLFNAYQIVQILQSKYGKDKHIGLQDTVRKCLYDMSKEGFITLITSGSGRGVQNVYQESRYVEAGNTDTLQRDLQEEAPARAT